MQRKNKLIRLLILILMFTSFNIDVIICQRVLSIELTTEIKTIKYFEGDNIEIKLVGEKEFQKDKIERLMVNENVIIFDRIGLTSLSSIDGIRERNVTANAMSKMLMTFGAAWMGYGLIASSLNRYEFDATSIAVGVTPIGVGYVTHKVAGYKKYIVGPRIRFRLLDLSIR